jgi:hypothetical protein
VELQHKGRFVSSVLKFASREGRARVIKDRRWNGKGGLVPAGKTPDQVVFEIMVPVEPRTECELRESLAVAKIRIDAIERLGEHRYRIEATLSDIKKK